MNKIYIPNLEDYTCVVMQDSDVIRGYKINPNGSDYEGKYKKVEYIKSTSKNTYINTGLKLNGNYTFVVEGHTEENSAGIFFDAYKNTSTRIGNIVYNRSSPRVDYWFTGVGYKSLDTTGIDLSKKFILTQNKDKISISQNGILNEVVLNGTILIDSTDILIFSTQRSDINSDSSYIYSFKVYENDTLIRDYQPVIRQNDNVLGFYEVIESKFYENAGTGSFIGGTIVSTSNSIPYVDYYINSHYTYKEGFYYPTYETSVQQCINKSNLTSEVYYRNDLADILLIFTILAIICIYLPIKLVFKFFKKR